MQHENKKWDFLYELSVANFIREFILTVFNAIIELQ